jgi:hypothetical protein
MSEEPVRVRVIGAQYSVSGERYEEGDEFELRREVAERHPLTLEILDEEDGDEDGSTDEGEESEDADSFDVDEWLEADYEERAQLVRDGEVDGHLDEIVEAETSDTVIGAAEERRAELGDG